MTFLFVLFWILFILAVLGVFASNSSPERAWLIRPSYGLLLLLIGILGWKTLGNPLQ